MKKTKEVSVAENLWIEKEVKHLYAKMEELDNEAQFMDKNMLKEIIEIDTEMINTTSIKSKVNPEEKCSQQSLELVTSLSATPTNVSELSQKSLPFNTPSCCERTDKKMKVAYIKHSTPKKKKHITKFTTSSQKEENAHRVILKKLVMSI